MPGPISTNEISSDLQAGPLASLCSVATARTLIPLALPDTYSGSREEERHQTPSAEPSAGVQPGSHYKLSPHLLTFSFFKIILSIPGIFCVDDTLLRQCFILFHFERKRGGKCHQSSGLPDEKVNQWVKSQHGSEKNNFKPLFRNDCITGLLFPQF